MFDANMRHLPKGMEFFAKVHYVKNCELYDLGVRKDDIIMCRMVSECNDSPNVLFRLDKKDVIISNSCEDLDCMWIVYEGNIDGTGFINDKSKDIAMKMIGI